MKPQCQSVQRYLSDYIDCTLSRGQTVTIAQHLGICRGCRNEVNSLRNTKVLLYYYVPPTPPDGYDSLFWQQLQSAIEENPRPKWRRSLVRSLSFVPGSRRIFDQCSFFLNSLIRHPIQWSWRWARLSPAYAVIFLVMLTTLLVYQGFQTSRKEQLYPTGAPQFLNASLSFQAHVEVDHNLVRDNLKKIAKIRPSSPNQFVHKTLRQSNLTDLTTEYLDWNGNPPTSGSDGEGFSKIITHDSSSHSLVFAQLSTPEPYLSREDYSQPLRAVINISYRFERKDNRSSSFTSGVLADVPLADLSLAKIL